MVSGSTRRVIAAGAIGNVLEWYDFAIYGYFAAAIGRTFFPQEDPVAQVLAAFGVFSVGFLMRPVGGVLVGYIGDRFGRRTALTFSVAAMAIPTFLVGALPGYETLGFMAPILLTVLRMVQGLSVGGEYTTSIVFMVERAPPGRRGLLGAIACCGANGGILLGSGTGALLAASMPSASLEAWGWRIPFLVGLLVGLAGFVLRRGLPDTSVKTAARRLPVGELVRTHGPLVARLAGLTVFNAVGFYLLFIFVVNWLQFADGVSPAHALGINTVSLFVLILAIFGMGWLSDRIGRKRLILSAMAAGFVGAVPLFGLMLHDDPVFILAGQLGFVLIIGITIGVQPAVMVESTPYAVRCTAIALGYNVVFGIIGGLTPLVATWLVHRTNDDLSPAYMVMAAAAVSFVTALLFFKETYRDRIEVD
jgi:MHS family proline/betaine transporter-like MFS transporter